MYRHAERRLAPTIVAYEARELRPGYLLLAAFFALMALGLLSTLHADRVACTRAGDAVCHVQRFGLWHHVDVTVQADQIAGLDVQVLTGSKGRKYAEVRLDLAPRMEPRYFVLESGSWSNIAPEDAFALRSRLQTFRRVEADRGFTQWLVESPSGIVFTIVVPCLMLLFASAIAREQIRQLRPVRLVVDHEREVLAIGGHEIPFGEIEGVVVEHGRALPLSSAKNEYVQGYRLAAITQRHGRIPATHDFRAGAEAVHAVARSRVLAALGRAT